MPGASFRVLGDGAPRPKWIPKLNCPPARVVGRDEIRDSSETTSTPFVDANDCKVHVPVHQKRKVQYRPAGPLQPKVMKTDQDVVQQIRLPSTQNDSNSQLWVPEAESLRQFLMAKLASFSLYRGKPACSAALSECAQLLHACGVGIADLGPFSLLSARSNGDAKMVQFMVMESRVEFESPHGHGRKEHKLDLPASFQHDQKYIDKNSCFGRQFYRNVCSTPWSQQVGLANRPVDSVKVHELCYLGWENHNLRALSAGAFVSVVFARSVREAQLADSLLRLCRTEHLDIESAAFNRWFQKYGDNPIDKDGKNKAVQELATEALSVIRKFHAPPCSSSDAHEVAELRKRVKELEAEKAASRKSSPSRSPAPPTSKRLRRGGNNLPVEHVTSSPLVKNDSGVKPLRENYPATVTAQGVNAWIRKLPKKKEASIKTAIKDAEQVFKQLSEPQLASLPDVAAEWGLSVKQASSAKDKELIRIIAAAHVLARDHVTVQKVAKKHAAAAQRYKDISVQEVGKWAEHHHLPVNEVVQQWLQFLSVEFRAHVKAVSGRFSVSDVLRAAQEMEDLVVHSRDHAYNQIMVFCPQLYRSAVLSTFEDKDVYCELAGHPYSIAKSAFDAIPCQLKSRYAWGIKETYVLPKAYVFLKKKKDFKQARSIINFRGSCLSRLCKIVACVLNEVCHVAFPANFGKLKLHELWSSLHGFLDRLSHAKAQEYVTVNDDLAGFFTSIPVSRLKRACELALDRFFDNKQSGGKNRGEFWFTVDEKSASSYGRVLRGKPMKNRASACRKVFAGDVLRIIELSFSFASFTVLGRCFAQRRGSPIGNQLSPSLCNIAVCMEEDCWVRGLRQCWASDRLACWFLRYVDNRFLLFPRTCLKGDAFQKLVMPTFYGPPVMLEACNVEELLGCRVSVHDRRVTFDIPEENWQYRGAANEEPGGVVL
ncbi:unnamed protein product [Symbiodinium sp. CCMP2592]|nr:unnamed protein product [Symbiodinium sp. CCMP2592]